MKWLIGVLFILLPLGLFSACGMEDNGDQAGPDDTLSEDLGVVEEALVSCGYWQALTQAQRNQAIINRGYQDNGRVVNLQCKPWVQQVVSAASQGCVTIPSTVGCGAWSCENSSCHLRVVVRNNSNFCALLKPGMIMQMCTNFVDGLHTAIIYSADYSGVTFLDSNWVGYPNVRNKVGIHFMTWADFYKKMSAFTVYEVIQ